MGIGDVALEGVTTFPPVEPSKDAEHRADDDWPQREDRAQDALGKDQGRRDRLLRRRVVARERPREDDLRQASHIDAQRPRHAVWTRSVNEWIVQRIARQRGLGIPTQHGREGARQGRLVQVSFHRKIGLDRRGKETLPRLHIENERANTRECGHTHP